METTRIQRLVCVIYNLAQRFITLDITHLMILDANTLREPTPLANHVNLTCLTPEQVRQYARDRATQLDPAMASRIDQGRDVCVAATSSGRLVAYGWYALGSIEAEHNCGRTVHCGTAISFPDHMAFLYKAFTSQEFRGLGLYKHVNRYALEHLKIRGITAILATTDWSNSPALKSCYGLGFRYLGKIWRFGFGSHVAGVYPTAAKQMTICCGDNAKVESRSNSWAAEGAA